MMSFGQTLTVWKDFSLKPFSDNSVMKIQDNDLSDLNTKSADHLYDIKIKVNELKIFFTVRGCVIFN